MNQRQKNLLYRYSMPILITLLAIGLQYLVIYQAKVAVPGILYSSCFLIAWWFGLGPALLSILLGSLGAVFLFYEPRFSFKALEHEDAVRLGIFTITSVLSSWVVARGKKAESELSLARNELVESQLRFERSAAASELGVWYCDLPFDELNWSRNAKSHFWLPDDARVTIDTFYERIHPDDRDRVRAAITESIAGRTSYDIEYRTVNPADSAQIKIIRAIGWTDYDLSDKPIRFDGITLDNTEVRQTVRQRDESLEVINTVNRVGKSLAAELDLEKLVQDITDAATQLSKAQFGAFFYNVKNEKGQAYTLYSISGVPRERFSVFPMPRNTQIFAPTFAGEGIVRSDDITQDPRYGKNSPYHGMPKGHLPVVSYLAVPVISRSGEVIGGLFFGHAEKGVFTDREERIVAGLASQAAITMDNARLFEKANQAIRIRDEFLSISSHELRTPLTPLKLQIQRMSRGLAKGTLTDEQLKHMLDSSERQIHRLTALIEDLLDVSRISSGKLTLNIEEVDLSESLREVVDRYLPQIQLAACELRLEVPPKLLARVDRLRFEQIFVNLLTNATKYAPGKPIDISLSGDSKNAYLKVKDHGRGIAEADQSRIFGRFERALASANYGGLGLGLFIVNQIVNAHGGLINLESAENEGASFTVTLPLDQPSAHASDAAPSPAPPPY